MRCRIEVARGDSRKEVLVEWLASRGSGLDGQHSQAHIQTVMMSCTGVWDGKSASRDTEDVKSCWEERCAV
jgi:hypothetical protein